MSLRFASSKAAVARVVVVEFIVSRTYSVSPESSPPPPPPPLLWVVEDVFVNEECDEKRGENQSPRKSKKQRSDQWQEERKRIRRRAEQ